MELSCPACQHRFHDATGQLERVFAMCSSGASALVLGCGRCGALAFPVLPHDAARDREVVATVVSAPPPSPTTRYELLKEIGRGGMGETFLAREEPSGQQVCVKRPPLSTCVG